MTWRILGLSAWLLACTPPTIDKPRLGHKHTNNPPSLHWLYGSWEVVSVNGVDINSLSEEQIPFQVLLFDSQSDLWLDTFSTTYVVLSNKPNKITLSYENIGYRSTFEISFVDVDNAELTESRQGNQPEPQISHLSLRRLK